jgi:hypothetical protein
MDFGPGFYLALSPRDAASYGSFLYRVVARLENPIIIGDHVDDELVDWFQRSLGIADHDLEEHDNPIAAAFFFADTLADVGRLKPSALVTALKKLGYDGVYVESEAAEAHNGVAVDGDLAILWDPAQILAWERLT